MQTQSVRKVEWLANTGCALGVLSWGLIAGGFIAPFVLPYDRHSLTAPFVAGSMILIFVLISLIPGLSGLAISLLVFTRSRKNGSDSLAKGIAIIGLVLNGLGVAIVLILFAYIFLFSPPNPPPVMLTPSPLVPSPPGG